MTVEYESTEEDAIDAISYLNHNLPQFRRQQRMLSIMRGIIFVLGVLMLAATLIKFTAINLIMGLYLIAMGVIMWHSQKKGMRSLFGKMVRSGAAKTMIGPHSYTVTPEGLASTSRFGRTVLYWSGIEKVVELENAIAFHFSSAQAILIPKRVFANQAHGAEFLRLAEQYRQQATGQSIPQTTRGTWWTQGQTINDSQSNQLGLGRSGKTE